MKKFLSALAAAALLCCTLVSPASAAETYKMGDVDMDGKITSDDAQLVLEEYCHTCIAHHETGYLTDAQSALAKVAPDKLLVQNGVTREQSAAYLVHALTILCYFTEAMTDSSVKETDITEWANEWVKGEEMASS